MFEQDRFISRLQRHVIADPAIRVCFLAGSFGRRTDDAYSDVDVALVFQDEPARSTAWERRRVFATSVMPYVPSRSFDAAHVRPFLHIALYSNGTKVDYLFETLESLQPNPWAREIRILKDNNQWAENFHVNSSRLAPSQPYISPAALAALDDRFWVMAWDVLRLLKRGDTGKPFIIYLELLYFTLPSLLAALPPEDPAHQGLLRASYSRDATTTARELAELLDAYLDARAAIVRRQNLPPPANTAFEAEIKRLVDKLAR
jgi:hypothetical protein